MQGEYVGEGYVKNKGPVEVYDTGKPNTYDCITRKDEVIRVNRDRVKLNRVDK
jgi:hypothetical protein